jgi:hypothetical protein
MRRVTSKKDWEEDKIRAKLNRVCFGEVPKKEVSDSDVVEERSKKRVKTV